MGDETKQPAAGQVWNWQDCDQWREVVLTEPYEGGWSGRGLDGDVGFFPAWRWRNGEMTFVRDAEPSASPGTGKAPREGGRG